MTKPKKKINYFIKIIILFLFIFSSFVSTIDRHKKIKTETLTFNQTLDLTAMAEKEAEDINLDLYAAKASYTGDLTGYSADCPLCNGTLSCKTSYKVYKNNVISYYDETYGDVRIVASSKQLACGSIVRFQSNRVGEGDTYAIVLDRGVLGHNLDLLVPSEAYATQHIGRSKITYDVLRFGW